jgi:hypothetical protein
MVDMEVGPHESDPACARTCEAHRVGAIVGDGRLELVDSARTTVITTMRSASTIAAAESMLHLRVERNCKVRPGHCRRIGHVYAA